MVGVADALGAEGREGAARGPALCLPTIEAEEAVDAVRRHLRVHPRPPGGAAGADLVAAALAEAFPCP